MSVQVLFRDFDRSLAVDEYLSAQATSIVQKYLPDESGYHVDILVREETHRNLLGKRPQFCCEVRVKIDGSKKVYKARKRGYDFYSCVNSVADSVGTILQRHHEKCISRRRRVPPLDQFVSHFAAEA